MISVCKTVHDAIRMLPVQRPDIALIDASLPGVWKVVAAAHESEARVIVFGLPDIPRPSEEAQRIGYDAGLPASASSRQLIHALEHLRLETHPLGPPADRGPLASLTQRELEVLAHVAEGRTNKEIAAALTVSVPTVKTHVHNVLFKLGAPRRADAGRMLRGAGNDSVPAGV